MSAPHIRPHIGEVAAGRWDGMNDEIQSKSLAGNAIKFVGRDDNDLGSRLLTVNEAAQYLKTSPAKVRRLIGQRQLTATKVGAHWRVSVDAILHYLEANISRSK